MKSDILEILDSQSQPVTSKTVQKKLGYGSLSTIQGIYHELQSELDGVYEDGRAKIKISNSGILLVRHGSNLQYMYAHLFSSDLSYSIMRELIVKRSVSTVDFCHENGISESTLKRKVKMINDVLQPYRVHIGVARKLTISGEEVDIRVISYAFLIGTHRQFSRIPWLADEKAIPQLSRKILEHLGIEVTDIKVGLLSIWVYITNISVSFHNKIWFSKEQEAIISALKLPRRPAFLKMWGENDWNLTFAAMYGSEVYGLFLAYQPLKDKKLSELFESLKHSWLTLFQEFFIRLSEAQSQFVADKIFQQFVHASFFSSVDELVNEEAHLFNFQQFSQSYPNYIARFEMFWQKFRAYLAGLKENFLYGKVCSLLLCVYLCPIEKLLPEVRIHFYTDLTALYENFLKNRIRLFLQEDYFARFEKDAKDAEIIITTVPLAISGRIRNHGQQILLVRQTFQENDLLELYEMIKERE